jgi:hypothetical protein
LHKTCARAPGPTFAAQPLWLAMDSKPDFSFDMMILLSFE